MSDKPSATILNVDDHDAARYATSRILRQAGYDTIEAANGKEALRLVKKHPDLVILDVNLPDIDGFEVCRRIKAAPATASIPVLHLSATCFDDESKIRGLEGGADGYLTQPIEPPVLLAYVKALLRGWQAEEALKKKTHDLGERVNELNCLYGIAKLIETPDISLDETLQAVVDLVPPAWRYPEITCSRILLNGKEWKTKTFKEANWKQSSDIFIHGKRVGGLEVYYLEERPEIDEGPFLNAITERLGRHIERIQAEEALRESENKFRNLFNNAEVGIFRSRLEGLEVVEINRKFLDIVGMTLEETLGKPSVNLWADPKEREEMVKRVVRDGSVSAFECKMLNKRQGDIRDCLLSLWLHREEGILEGSILDVTKRKRAEEALRSSEQKYKSLVENIGIGVAMISPSMEILTLNKKMKEWFPDIDISKRPICYEAYNNPPQKDLCTYCPTCITLKDGGVHESVTDTPIGGKIIHYRIVSSPITSDDGKVIAAIEMVEDITERIQAERVRANLESQLRQAYKMEAIGTLAGGIAHDFNNVLGIIIGNVELAKDEIPHTNPAHQSLEEARQACLRAKDIVGQILTFSREKKMEFQPVDLKPVVREGLKMLRSSIPTTIDIQENITEASATILGDPSQIYQIIMNLCTNSAHAMEEMGSVLQVRLSSVELDETALEELPELKAGKYVRLTVSDTGEGIKREIIHKIFDPYFTTKAVGKGTGMGLAIVHGIVKEHGGAITVYSEPGQGTTFHVFFPKIESGSEKQTVEFEELPRGNERILFVDDEKSLARLGKQMLERLGYEVDSRTSPLETLTAFRDHPDKFDLVITDMTMPQMLGDVLAKQVMEIRPGIPVILCTGFSYRIDEEKASAMGIKGFIMKPLAMRELAKTVREILDSVS
jgi:PAS domain S-box-containing protein